MTKREFFTALRCIDKRKYNEYVFQASLHDKKLPRRNVNTSSQANNFSAREDEVMMKHMQERIARMRRDQALKKRR